MRVNVRLFARFREAVGRDRLEVDVPEGGTVEAAWEAVARSFPALASYRPFALFALGDDYVPPERRLCPGDELCFFPPVSGGADGDEMTGDLVVITSGPLSERALVEAVEDPGAGGIALFSGVVRNHTDRRGVKFLEYEAHLPMAEAKMHEIAAEVRTRWPEVLRVAIAHRIGRLEIGESSVMIAVSSPHRRQAFEACRFAIDTLKETVPIWKKEYFEDGEVWVGLPSGGA
jgi:molybdopterin synthase catalytic subunit/molybdopterin converting factor small subunit